ncbi:hypothetical protein PR003_g30555 [Phytophthora rubi]|uniref:Uncharacterized protein n=1 Tax=Phytophthora rubi TaxID=129364 RepID=A0A6A3H122_9STRA|nr:hypothetical protein PR001_g31790 [Phytophthora rubi]KAE8963141.1 hypothetical protein PR002_g29375 [Phytophthora rubi]KAE9271291.1 hypothetical protein PR003_g30555 [Phytophthora rubi]
MPTPSDEDADAQCSCAGESDYDLSDIVDNDMGDTVREKVDVFLDVLGQLQEVPRFHRQLHLQGHGGKRGQHKVARDLISLFLESSIDTTGLEIEADEAAIMRDMVTTFIFAGKDSSAHSICSGWPRCQSCTTATAWPRGSWTRPTSSA